MRLVHHQQTNARGHGLQHRLHELLVAQPFRGDEQHVHTIGEQFIADAPPIITILFFRRDSNRSDACAPGGGDLIPHQRQQRRNDERRPGMLFAEQFCGDEIDITFAPAGALHDEQRSAPFQQMFNRFELSPAESGL